jgi:integrase
MANIKKMENDTFKATIYLGRDAKGKQIRKTLYATSEKECKNKARVIEQEYQDGLYIDTKKMRFTKWAEEWLELRKDRISPSTLQSYDIYINIHFKPHFGNLKISQINELMIKRYIAEKLKTLSSTTVRKHIYILSAILEDVLKHKNPCKYIEIPEVAHYEYHIVTDDEYKIIREFFRGKAYEPIILLGALCGMRRGEIFALKWDDIDEKAQTIRVDQAMCISKEGYIEKKTKSNNGFRTIIAPDEIFNLLERKRKQQKVIKERIFPSRPDSFSSWFSVCMTKLNLDIRFHDLRHYHATWLYKNGIPDLFAAQRLGDDLNTIKRIYQHIGEDTTKKYNDEIIKRINTI